MNPLVITEGAAGLIGGFVVALATVFITFRQAKRDNFSKVVTEKRMALRNEMWTAMLGFLCEYLKKNPNNEETPNNYLLHIKSAELMLCIRNYSYIYIGLKRQLDKCTKSEFSDEDYEKLMIEMQSVLNYKWRRIKTEAGEKDDITDNTLESRKKILQEKRKQYIEYRTEGLGQLHDQYVNTDDTTNVLNKMFE